MTIKPRTLLDYGAALILAAVALALTVFAFDRLPIEGTSLALDWRGLWPAFQHWPPLYGDGSGLRNPPWDALLLAPLGLLSLRASWGVLSLITLLVQIVSVPRSPARLRYWAAILLLCASYVGLRHLADGNFESLVIAGGLLILLGYSRRNIWALAAGILVAAVKVQEVWLLLAVLGFYILKTWPFRTGLRLTVLIAAVVLPTMVWLGPGWLHSMAGIPQRGSIMDSSLLAAGGRLGAPGWLSAAVWLALAAVTVGLVLKTSFTLSREKAGLLIAASLLLSPYAAGNSYLTVLALAVIPIFLTRPGLGLILLALTDLPFLFSTDVVFNYSAYYWTAMLLLTFAVCAWLLWNAEIRQLRQADVPTAV